MSKSKKTQRQADKRKNAAMENRLNAQTGKWKPPVTTYIIVMVLALYFGVLVGCNYTKNDTIIAVFNKISYRLQDGAIWNVGIENIPGNFKNFIACVFLFLMIGFLYVIISLSSNHNYMRGKEFGTANWATPESINRKFESNNPSWNRVYSDSVRISMKSHINNNVLVIGGSGVGKSFYLLTPNIYQADKDSLYPGSYIFTDPKGELLQKNGAYLKEKGYRILVLNLVPGMMQESDCFNPFEYIRNEGDITRLITNLQSNTDGNNAAPSDPFWPKAEAMFLKSLFLLVWMEHEFLGKDKSLNTVLWLLSLAEISDDPNVKSPLDEIFDELVESTQTVQGKGDMHPAWLAYKKTMVGAADTKRSIVITANARLAVFENPEIKRIMSKDELDLASIGTGIVDGKKGVKTALFCVIPDSDTSYNCIAGMLYTLLFQELYFQADFKYHGELPVPVTFWLDEFANIALPQDFIKMLTTMRSRLISCVIIIQNLAQLKALFEKEWEEVPGNCDVSVYLGGNEQSTFEYISKNLGKKTIYKKSSGETKGSHGSVSSNEDALGRELMLPEEVREIDNDFCIVFVRGKKPIFDYKFRTLQSPEFEKSKKLGTYLHSQAKQLGADELHIELVSAPELAEAYRLGRVIELNLDESLMKSPEYMELQELIIQNAEEVQKELANAHVIDIRDIELMDLLADARLELSDEELVEVTEGIKNGLSDEQVKQYILYNDAKRMRSQRLLFEALNARRGMS